MLYSPLPSLSLEQMSKSFIWEGSIGDVTTIDTTLDGAYVFIGLSDGLILLFDMMSPKRHGHVIGSIQPKGFHTNLLLTVRVSEDSRFVFAGVCKGSVELLALDIGSLPTWNHRSVEKDYHNYIYTHKYSNQKLRGFDSAAKVSASEYRLVCGKGIKNLHIWQFLPDFSDEQGRGRWVFLFDVVTNGNTLECTAFRSNGSEVLSKSSNANLRIWTLPNPTANAPVTDGVSDSVTTDDNTPVTNTPISTPNVKLPYEDVPDTQTIRSIHGDYAFGGLYELLLLNHAKYSSTKTAAIASAHGDAIGDGNIDASSGVDCRSTFILPDCVVEWENELRKKRLMRQVDEIVSTQDGTESLVVCSDGGVIYCNQPQSTFHELVDLRFKSDLGSYWSMRRVGSQGSTVLIQSCKNEARNGITIDVLPLQNVIPSLNLKASTASSQAVANNWSTIERYHNHTFTFPVALATLAAGNDSTLLTAPRVRASLPKERPPRPVASRPTIAAVPRTSVTSVSKESPMRHATDVAPCTPSFVTPEVMSAAFNQYISPHDQLQALAMNSSNGTNGSASDHSSWKTATKRALLPSPAKSSISEACEDESSVKRPKPCPPFVIPRLVPSNAFIARTTAVTPPVSLVLDAYHILKEEWLLTAVDLSDSSALPNDLQRPMDFFVREASYAVSRQVYSCMKVYSSTPMYSNSHTWNAYTLQALVKNFTDILMQKKFDYQQSYPSSDACTQAICLCDSVASKLVQKAMAFELASLHLVKSRDSIDGRLSATLEVADV